MTLLSVERIKLFSTKSPYWCLASILAAALLFALLMGTVEGGKNASTFLSQAGMQIGMSVFMVLSALAITTEYRFGTVRVSFLAVPQRASVLVAKTAVLVILGVVVALISSFAAFFLTKVLAGNAPATPLTLSTGDDWRIVLGHTALFGIAAIAAVAVGSMVRQSAGAITILLVWPLLIENLISLIPSAGPKIQPWMPFHAGSAFVSPPPNSTVFGEVVPQNGPTPVQGLLVFAGTAVILWVIALVLMKRRDA
jgi:ABC-2 type transport system permease protein